LIALAVGIPLGAIAGRWGWRVFVNTLGFVPQPIVPMLAVLLTIPIALLLANAIASIPARAAARTQPAAALRAE
jgi:ABC-type lipoprotein release transport system permease subunit